MKYIIKLKLICGLFILFINLINAWNVELIKTVERFSLSLSICIPLRVVGAYFLLVVFAYRMFEKRLSRVLLSPL
jgi:hypothetical protein